VYTGFWWGNVKERYHLEDPNVDGRMILRWIYRKWDVRAWSGSMLLKDRDGWRALVIAVLILRFPQNAGNFLTS